LDSISVFVFCENMQVSDREERFFSGLKNRFFQGDRATIQIRPIVIAHFREQSDVMIKEDVNIGPGAIALPNVTIGHGAIVTAGIVMTKHSAENNGAGQSRTTHSQGRRPLGLNVSVKEFVNSLRSRSVHIFPECASRRRQVAFCVKALRSKNYCAREGRAHP